MRLYDRKIRVEVGLNNGQGIATKGLQIVFDIKKMVSQMSAEGTVDIYNLSEKNETHIRKSATRIRVFAGYGDSLNLIHDGDIRRVDRINTGGDRITQITLGGRVYAATSATFNASYQKGHSLRGVVQDVLKTFPFDFHGDLSVVPNIAMPALCLSGNSSTILNNLLTPHGIQWFEDNNSIKLSVRKQVLKGAYIPLLDSNSGLIKTAVTTERGVNAISLLRGDIKIGNLIKIQSDILENSAFRQNTVRKVSSNSTGIYKVFQIQHTFSQFDGPSQTSIQAVEFDLETQSTA